MLKFSLLFPASCPTLSFAQLTVTPEICEFGLVRENERPSKTLTLKNTGDSAVAITELLRTCVCADATLEKTRLEPGETSTVAFLFDPNVLGAGPFSKTFLLRTDNPKQPLVMMPLRGETLLSWKIEPQSGINLGAKGTTAEFKLIPSENAPAITGIEIFSGASMHPSLENGVKETRAAAVLGTNTTDNTISLSFSPPADIPPGCHHWSLRLKTGSDSGHSLVLNVSKESGVAWTASPRMIRAPAKVDTPFTCSIYLKPSSFDGMQSPEIASIDPATITVTPAWDGVEFAPVGKSNKNGFEFKMTIPVEMFNSWTMPKTFHFTIPGSGAASLYLEKAAPK